jgi:GNAT superfamily N-acetyltransferase
VEFVEAPAAFTPPAPDSATVSNERFTLRGSIGGTWLAVQRIRLRDDEIDDAVDAARSFMRVTGATVASWWLTEHSTPADLEEQLLERGLFVVEGDYAIDGMLLTSEPPAGPSDIEARAVSNADEFVAATEAQYAAFNTPTERRRDIAVLIDEFEFERQSDVVRLYGAWLDRRLVGGGRAIFSPRGALLSGGSTVPSARGRGVYRALVRARWDDAATRGTPALAVQAGAMSAPILSRLGFEKVCQFRRIEDVLSDQ